VRWENEFEPMPLDPRVERAVRWLRENVPGAEPGLVALERETTAGGTLIAGGLAYRLFLWLLPFSLVVAALGIFWEEEDPQGFESASEDFGLSASAARSMRRSIEASPKGTWYFLILGLFSSCGFRSGSSVPFVSHIPSRGAFAARGFVARSTGPFSSRSPRSPSSS